MSTKIEFNEEVFQSILHETANGRMGIQRLLLSNELYPSYIVWLRWMQDEENKTRYARAKDDQADNLRELAIDAAYASNADIVGINETTGKPIVDGDAIQRSRLIVDTLKWAAAKLAPKKYGDKLDVTSDGEKIMSMPEIVVYNQAPPMAESEKDITN